MKEYIVRRTPIPAPLTADNYEGPWATANVLEIDQFPWYAGGSKQRTWVRALYDPDALYLQFHAEDRHISSKVTELNGPVCTDSCVEFFASPEPDKRPHYFNFEANCCGVFHLGWGAGRPRRRLIGRDLANGIEVMTAFPGKTKEESPADEHWWLTVTLHFDILGEFIGRPIAAKPGSVWKGNFYRCGGVTDPQYATWNPVGTPGPDFHQPEFFGTLRFE